MLNAIFLLLIVASVLVAAFASPGQGMEALTIAIVDSARTAVELAIKLIGVMAFFLGLMKVAEDGGLLRILARAVGPVLRFLFPSVPRDHPAMSAIILNLSANALGLGNAATPFGIKAMMELDKLNGAKGTATNAMVVFLAINTAGFAILPATAIAMRAAVGSKDPTGIFFPTWFASGCATIVAVTAAMVLSRFYRRSEPPVITPSEESTDTVADPDLPDPSASFIKMTITVAALAALAVALGLYLTHSAEETSIYGRMRHVLSYWILPTLVASLLLFGWARGVKVYESVVEGAKEGFNVAVRIIPYMVAILVMVGMVRASGLMDLAVLFLNPVTSLVGMPAEALPMALLRPLSGSGAYAVMGSIMEQHGADSLIGYMVSTFQGSTETTFYVLAVYFGSVGVKRTRHALPACLLADVAGILAAVFIVNRLFG
jgi:spore maturation protein SpmA